MSLRRQALFQARCNVHDRSCFKASFLEWAGCGSCFKARFLEWAGYGWTFLLSDEDNGSIWLALIVTDQYACNCHFFLYNSERTFYKLL